MGLDYLEGTVSASLTNVITENSGLGKFLDVSGLCKGIGVTREGFVRETTERIKVGYSLSIWRLSKEKSPRGRTGPCARLLHGLKWDWGICSAAS